MTLLSLYVRNASVSACVAALASSWAFSSSTPTSMASSSSSSSLLDDGIWEMENTPKDDQEFAKVGL